MRTKNTLKLPKPKELQSTKLEDIQDYFERIFKELSNTHRLLWQDVAVFQVDKDGFIYFGNKDTDGSWRLGTVSGDFLTQHRENGKWISRGMKIKGS